MRPKKFPESFSKCLYFHDRDAIVAFELKVGEDNFSGAVEDLIRFDLGLRKGEKRMMGKKELDSGKKLVVERSLDLLAKKLCEAEENRRKIVELKALFLKRPKEKLLKQDNYEFLLEVEDRLLKEIAGLFEKNLAYKEYYKVRMEAAEKRFTTLIKDNANMEVFGK